MKSVFTFLWCIKLNFDPNCVYFTSFIFDTLIFLWTAPYAFGTNGWGFWAYYIYLAIAICSLLMAIFAIIQIITKNSSASSRHATYVQCRLFMIIGLAVGGILIFILYMVAWKGHNNNDKINWSLRIAAPLLINAAILHSYHENFA